MDTITKIIEKIKKTGDTRTIHIFGKITLFTLFMFSSFIFGRMSVLSQKEPELEKNIEVYLPDGNLYTKESPKEAISPLSAYILGAVDNTSKIEEVSAKQRISNLETDEEEVNLELLDPESETGKIFGSKNGKVYYVEGCTAGNRVKSENRVYFDKPDEAEEEGYTQSKLCK